MRKFMGSAIGGVAVVVLASGLVGCRSTASHLASVPGFGWLDRGDEGWANYEPSPELPKPSTTAEPTVGGPAANLADNDQSTSPFAKPIGTVAQRDSKSRFDTDRYLPKKDAAESTSDDDAKPSFGNYASAYGKYAPPKFSNPVGTETGSTKSLAAQDGPYSVDADSETSQFASNASTNRDFTTDSKAPSFGPALGEQVNANERQPEFTASSESRFGAPAFDNGPATTAAPKTYTPPGFPTTPQTNTITNRFDNAAQNTFDNGQQTFNRFTNEASNAAQAMANAGSQQLNRFTNDASNALNNAATTASNQFNAATNTPNWNTTQTPNNNSLTDATKQAFGNAVNATQSTATNAYNNAVAGAQQMASDYQNAATNAIQDAGNRFGNVAANQAQAVTESAQNIANNVQSEVQSYVQGATQGLENRFGNVANPSTTVPNAIQNAGQNIAQGVTNQVQNYTQNAVNSVEQGVVSKYEQAKSAATDYANAAANQAAQQAGNLVNSAASGAQPIADAAQNAYNAAGNQLNQAANTLNNVMRNVSNSQSTTPAQYPSTSTPNPFLNPSSTAPGTPSSPGLNSSPANAPATNSTPTIQRNSTPFLPGSTKSFQSSVTVRKQEIQIARDKSTSREPLLLAVGDKYQFPLNLR